MKRKKIAKKNQSRKAILPEKKEEEEEDWKFFDFSFFLLPLSPTQLLRPSKLEDVCKSQEEGGGGCVSVTQSEEEEEEEEEKGLFGRCGVVKKALIRNAQGGVSFFSHLLPYYSTRADRLGGKGR